MRIILNLPDVSKFWPSLYIIDMKTLGPEFHFNKCVLSTACGSLQSQIWVGLLLNVGYAHNSHASHLLAKGEKQIPNLIVFLYSYIKQSKCWNEKHKLMNIEEIKMELCNWLKGLSSGFIIDKTMLCLLQKGPFFLFLKNKNIIIEENYYLVCIW